MKPDTKDNQPQPLPIWLSIPIILVCLAGGGWIIHWYVMTDPVSHESTLLGAPPAQPSRQQNNSVLPRPANNVRSVEEYDKNRGLWTVHTQEASADFAIVNGKTTFRLATFNMNHSFVPQETWEQFMRARSVVTDKDQTRFNAMKFTPEQVKQLKSLVGRVFMNVSASDKNLLLADFDAYVQASQNNRASLAAKVEQTLDEVAKRSTDPTRELIIEHVKQINAIMTPEVWQQDSARNSK